MERNLVGKTLILYRNDRANFLFIFVTPLKSRENLTDRAIDAKKLESKNALEEYRKIHGSSDHH